LVKKRPESSSWFIPAIDELEERVWGWNGRNIWTP
jgi:hypothetical protein